MKKEPDFLTDWKIIDENKVRLGILRERGKICFCLFISIGPFCRRCSRCRFDKQCISDSGIIGSLCHDTVCVCEKHPDPIREADKGRT